MESLREDLGDVASVPALCDVLLLEAVILSGESSIAELLRTPEVALGDEDYMVARRRVFGHVDRILSREADIVDIVWLRQVCRPRVVANLIGEGSPSELVS